MKIIKQLSIILLATAILMSCSSEPKETPVVDLYNVKGNLDIKLSDVASDLRFVPLETRDDLLLPRPRSISITDNYIVTADDNNLVLFDKNGKYLKRLAIKGNGPEEFNMVTEIKLDEKNGILYYTDYSSRQELKRVNINTGKHLPVVDMGDNGFSVKSITEDGNLIIGAVGSVMVIRDGSVEQEDTKKDSSLFNILNPNTLEKRPINAYNETAKKHRDNSVMTYKNDSYLFNRANSDTLYRYRNDKITPYIYLPVKSEEVDVTKGTERLSIHLKYKDGFLMTLEKQELKIIESGQGMIRATMVVTPIVTTLVKDNGEAERVKNLILDNLDYKIKIKEAGEEDDDSDSDMPKLGFRPTIDREYLCYSYEAETLMIVAEKALEKNNLNDSQRKALEELLKTISEDSNPVLVIGKIK